MQEEIKINERLKAVDDSFLSKAIVNSGMFGVVEMVNSFRLLQGHFDDFGKSILKKTFQDKYEDAMKVINKYIQDCSYVEASILSIEKKSITTMNVSNPIYLQIRKDISEMNLVNPVFFKAYLSLLRNTNIKDRIPSSTMLGNIIPVSKRTLVDEEEGEKSYEEENMD